MRPREGRIAIGVIAMQLSARQLLALLGRGVVHLLPVLGAVPLGEVSADVRRVCGVHRRVVRKLEVPDLYRHPTPSRLAPKRADELHLQRIACGWGVISACGADVGWNVGAQVVRVVGLGESGVGVGVGLGLTTDPETETSMVSPRPF